jgi:Tfp pilus assembly protein PilN
MVDTLFCLDISSDAVTGVLVEKTGKVTVITGCGSAEIDEQSLESGIETLCHIAGFSGGECSLSLGIEVISFRNLSLPFSDKKKIAQILPLELENLSATEMEQSITDFVIAESDEEGTQIVTATIEKSTLASFLRILDKLHFNPVTIEIKNVRVALHLADSFPRDCVVLDIHDTVAGLIVVSAGQIALVRFLRFNPIEGEKNSSAERLDLLVKKTLLASRVIDISAKAFTIFLTGMEGDFEPIIRQLSLQFEVKVKPYLLVQQPLVKIAVENGGEYRPGQMDAVFALALKTNVKNKIFNFRKEEFRKKKSVLELRTLLVKTVVPVLFVVVVTALYLAYDYKQKVDMQKMLHQQIVQVFSQTLPKVTRIVNPLQQLRVEIKEIRKIYSTGAEGSGEYTMLSLLTEISARIPPSYSVTIKRMVADVDTVRLKGVTKDFNTVDNMQKELEKSSYFQTVTISSASQSTEGDEVRFELKLELL